MGSPIPFTPRQRWLRVQIRFLERLLRVRWLFPIGSERRRAVIQARAARVSAFFQRPADRVLGS